MLHLFRWLLHHVTILVALAAVSTLLGLGIGTGFFIGGSSWEQSIQLGRFLCLVLLFPSGLLWLNNVVRDFRQFSWRGAGRGGV
jgi:hypothetical protein